MKYGAKMIAESTLEAVENDNPDRNYEIDFTIPEFTCLCPRSNFPDFATIRIKYVPDQKLVELKSLKLYINKFRDQEMFHETAVNRILDDLVSILSPRYLEVVGDFNVRGNIKSIITARHVQPGFSPNGLGPHRS
ncbi:MAG TPA: preQ(1) synthase [Candidatus Dormibacteraeota bacterium]|jgi:7-cyano-7-deazaguanine reductase|nr:preQ(1) synthase [Candidatus Dormibacteraeota bacterium]